jgi:hypothetical protein
MTMSPQFYQAAVVRMITVKSRRLIQKINRVELWSWSQILQDFLTVVPQLYINIMKSNLVQLLIQLPSKSMIFWGASHGPINAEGWLSAPNSSWSSTKLDARFKESNLADSVWKGPGLVSEKRSLNLNRCVYYSFESIKIIYLDHSKSIFCNLM